MFALGDSPPTPRPKKKAAHPRKKPKEDAMPISYAKAELGYDDEDEPDLEGELEKLMADLDGTDDTFDLGRLDGVDVSLGRKVTTKDIAAGAAALYDAGFQGELKDIIGDRTDGGHMRSDRDDIIDASIAKSLHEVAKTVTASTPKAAEDDKPPAPPLPRPEPEPAGLPADLGGYKIWRAAADLSAQAFEHMHSAVETKSVGQGGEVSLVLISREGAPSVEYELARPDWQERPEGQG
ncbi:unnamed protein product [Prorocentrum cordatum]|uniref:Uncharacterized protein n=1 Tax=Prorocentrum cordatum TaxID=2364126 RepID=A0ABN9TKW6_9DINO|nr:unnamed protein product [Polarella glacialis]